MGELIISSSQLKALLISIILAIVGYLAFSLWSGWQQVINALLAIGLSGSLIALGLSLINYLLRFIRWQLYLNQLNVQIEAVPSLRIYLAGFSLTTTPGKAGEMIRALLLSTYGVRTSTTFSAFISERISDLIAIALLSLLGLSHYPQWHPLIVVTLTLIICGLIVLGSTPLTRYLSSIHTQPGTLTSRLLMTCTTLLQQTQRCHRYKIIIASTILSLIAWTAEALAFYYVLHWLSLEISFSTAAFIYAISMLAGALSFLPGGLGSAEAVMVSLLNFNDMPLADAVAATVFIRLVTLWFAVLLGITALWKSQTMKGCSSHGVSKKYSDKAKP